uniref:Uncharacterized protein n=1 Tax=Gossypium raimondii TaxID=29730 RepID=A0A0D2N4H9_GOSRA|nr:hypothetical protein B456_004G272600 [Gossypium raimondii]
MSIMLSRLLIWLEFFSSGTWRSREVSCSTTCRHCSTSWWFEEVQEVRR